MSNNLYNEDSIQSLSPLQHVRTRPSMYIGATDTPYQLVIEILSNAIDEYRIGNGKTIILNITDDGKISCQDEAQGFIVDSYREDGKSILQASFDTLNTSGKFTSDGVYEGSALGLHGQGSKIANFLSHEMIVESVRDGIKETIFFKEGKFQDRIVEKTTVHSGTRVTFKPSEEFFTSTKIDIKKLKNFCDDITCLCEGLVIVVNGDCLEHKNGIQDLLEKNLSDIEIINNRFIFQKKKDKQSLKVAMTYSGKNSSTIIPYVNCGITTAGPHITSIKSTITRILNKWAKEQGILKTKEKNLDGNSLQEGMIFIADITADEVAYNAQIKDHVAKIDTSFISSTLGEQLEIWLDNNPDDGKAIIEKALVSRKAAEAAKRARERVRNKAAANTKKKNIQLPTTLTDCWSKDRLSCELLIAEGKSAASGLVAARDSETLAVYGVRGKMLSVLKTAPANIYKNQEINNLVQALGLEVEPSTCKLKYDKTKLRYGKIVACADADFDGFAIENLLFNILWYMCPELILNGHVYSAVPPLFRVTTKKNEYIYLKDEKALEDYKKQNSNNIQTIGRMKGLGECDSDELAYCLLDKKTRNVLQLKVTDRDKTDEMFNNLYGKAVGPRVTFLAEHLEEARVE